jgi:hypothetical protein
MVLVFVTLIQVNNKCLTWQQKTDGFMLRLHMLLEASMEGRHRTQAKIDSHVPQVTTKCDYCQA